MGKLIRLENKSFHKQSLGTNEDRESRSHCIAKLKGIGYITQTSASINYSNLRDLLPDIWKDPHPLYPMTPVSTDTHLQYTDVSEKPR